MIDIRIKLDGFDDLMRIADPKIFNRVASRTLNEAVSKGQSEGVAAVYEEFNLTKRDIKSKTHIRRSRVSTLEATLGIYGHRRGMGLMRFNPTWRRGRGVVKKVKGELTRTTNKRAGRDQGVKVKIRRGGDAVVLRRAWIARGRRGDADLSTTTAQVWIRRSDGRVHPVRIPKPETMFFRMENVMRIIDAANRRAAKRIPHHLRRELAKKKR